MTNSTQLAFLLSQVLAQLPEITVCLGICILVLVKWRQTPSSAVWALLGFGLLLVLVLMGPGLQLAARRWVMANGADLKRAGLVLTLYAAFWSAWRALAYGLIAAAVYTGRSSALAAPAPIFPPPLPPRRDLPPA